MIQCHIFSKGLALSWPCALALLLLFWIPAFGAKPIDGFRNLQFGMTPQEVQTLKNCSTSQECIYELSGKNRYAQLTYGLEDGHTDKSSQHLRLSKITFDMGQYSEGWYSQLQMILGNSYRLTHDFTDETMNAFLAKQFEELQAGYEDGQIVLIVNRRPFGNMTLKMVYQDTVRAAEFIRQQAHSSSR